MKRVKKVLPAAAVLGLLAAAALLVPKIRYYFFHTEYKEVLEAMEGSVEEGAEAFEPLSGGRGEVPGFVLAAETETLELYVNMEDSQVAVYDRRNGNITYSNPQEEDPIARSVNEEELKSQIGLLYYNPKRTAMTMNNYTMSIAKEQFELRRLKNGVRVIYTLGDLGSSTGIVPVYITEERLQELVLDKLSEKDAKSVRSKYAPSSTHEGYLELAGGVIKSKLTMKKFQGYFEEAGYTAQDYLADMEVAGEEEGGISFQIALDYRLEGEELVASIPASLIRENGGAKIGSISLLKFFGCAGMEEAGYMVVPNGSGSLIYFNNGCRQEAYSQTVYGTDPIAANYIRLEQTQRARLPVFGLKKEKGSLFARIDNGDAFAAITADVAGKGNGQNYVYATFQLRPSELLSMFGSTGGAADLPLVEDPLYSGELSVRYAFLEGEDADYSRMAAYYRNILVEEGILARREAGELPLYLDILGGVQKKEFFLGVPYLTDYPMTTFDQAEDIAGKLQEEGIGAIRMNYLGWFNGGYYHDTPDHVKVLSGLGGKKGLGQLTDMVEAGGGKVFADVAFWRVSQQADGFSPMFEASKYYSGIYLELGQVNPATVRQTDSLGYEETLYYTLSPRYLGHYVQAFAECVQEVPVSGIALRDLGDALTSDKKRSELVNREQSKYIVQDAFGKLEGTGKDLLVKGGDFYSLAYASDIVDAPLTDTGFFIVDEQIPFYQMVIHGYINYGGSAINLNGSMDERQLVLHLIEMGASPHFILSAQDASQIKYTGLNAVYTSWEEYWLEDVLRIYTEVSRALNGVEGQAMVSHEILAENVAKVTYENGAVYYINKNPEAVITEGITIPGYGYEVR